ncbi:hypothetical protein [Paucibacter soli]|uniref:hypothetical protein n=1 Tax=Paucibacter soli TaxID=3133433 RepID=UPI0030B33C39
MHQTAMTPQNGVVAHMRRSAHGGRASSQGQFGDRESCAARDFVRWFGEQHGAGNIAMPFDRMLSVQPSLSADFCVGLHDMRYFAGIPKSCKDWFSALPWACVSIDPLTGRLAFICREVDAPGLHVPAFALSFDVSPAGYTDALTNYHFIDVRSIEPIPGSASLRISREVVLTPAIRVEEPLKLLSDLAADSLQ